MLTGDLVSYAVLITKGIRLTVVVVYRGGYLPRSVNASARVAADVVASELYLRRRRLLPRSSVHLHRNLYGVVATMIIPFGGSFPLRWGDDPRGFIDKTCYC